MTYEQLKERAIEVLAKAIYSKDYLSSTWDDLGEDSYLKLRFRAEARALLRIKEGE